MNTAELRYLADFYLVSLAFSVGRFRRRDFAAAIFERIQNEALAPEACTPPNFINRNRWLSDAPEAWFLRHTASFRLNRINAGLKEPRYL